MGTLLIALVAVALLFDFLNGLHDAANSIATIVSTRVLAPRYAVAWASFFNFIAFLVFGLHVAKTIGTGIVATSRPNKGTHQLVEAKAPGLWVVPFIRLGSRVFHTAAMPLAPRLLLEEARRAPLTLTHNLWMWLWHAFVLWAAIALVAAPLMALAITPLLERMLTRIRRHQYPIVPTSL